MTSKTSVLWRDRFRAAIIAHTRIAPRAPDRGLVVSNRSGTYQLYAWDVPTGELQQRTDRPRGTLSGVISPDGGSISYLDDEHGGERGHYVRIPFEGGCAHDLTPGLPPYRSWDLCFSRLGLHGAFTFESEEGFALCIVPTDAAHPPGALRLSRHDHPIGYPALSSTGDLVTVAAAREKPYADSIIALDPAGGETVAHVADAGSRLRPIMFSPVAGDARLLLTSNRSGFTRPLIWNAVTGRHRSLALDELKGDVIPLDWSADASTLLLCHFRQARQQLYLYEVPASRLRRLEHPPGTFGYSISFHSDAGGYFAPGGEIFALWNSSVSPPRLIALGFETGRQTRTILSAGEVPPGRPWRSISFTSSDGQEIQGWLAVPGGNPPYPTVLHLRGGPHLVTTDSFQPASQAWLDHGFAYLTVNYRGSTTFGRTFQDQIVGDFGHWELEDTVAARAWLVEQGLADPKRIILSGWSYGGYLTLLALGRRPDLWAAGIVGVAVADLIGAYYETTADSRAWLARGFGGTPEEKPDVYAASSPLTYAEQVRAPLLIIQGRNDPRCPPGQMERYVATLKELGKAAEVHWLDEGHVAARAEAEGAIRNQELMLQFVRRCLNGTAPSMRGT